MRREWTKEEDERLIAIANDESSKLSAREIGEMFGRSEASVKHRATRLGCPVLGRKKVKAHPEELKRKVLQLNQEGKTVKEITQETGLPDYSIAQWIRNAGCKTNDPTRWSQEEVEWLRTNYPTRGGRFCAEYLGMAPETIRSYAGKHGIKRIHNPDAPIPNLAVRRVYDEAAICKAYETAKNLKEVAAQFDTDYNQISKILKRNGIEVRLYSRFREYQEEIVQDYIKGDKSVSGIGRKYGLSGDRITEGLKGLGVFDPSRDNTRFYNRKSIHQCWIEKHGKQIADSMFEAYLADRRLNAPKGKDNPMFGKPSPQGSGNGWKGRYKSHYFRSLREAMFMIEMDEKGIEWKTAETKEYTINYEWLGKPRTYRPDFIIGKELWELKPKKLHKSPLVMAKRVAAEAFCAEKGLVYRLEDIKIKKDVIHKAYLAGLVGFDRDYEKRFLEYAA